MTTYSIYSVIPHYNSYDGVCGFSLRHTGRRYVTLALALKMRDVMGSAEDHDDYSLRVVRDGDETYGALFAPATAPLIDDLPF